MDIFSVITLLGGLAFFLFGMHIMSSGLEKMAGGKLESTLKRLTSNPWMSLLSGAGITVAIQSSSALTVMLVGLVNSGIMELGQTTGAILGSHIGTTLTAWVLSLSGISDNANPFLRLLKPESFAPLIALIGIAMLMMSKKQRRKDIGMTLLGFSVLMFGMTVMSGAVSPLADMPEFAGILTAFKNPLLGVLTGAVVTGIIQSSAASVGILQALSLTGGITYGMAIPIIMGQNIGTCATALISSIGVNRDAKRVAVVHVVSNIIGTAACLVILYALNAIFRFEFMTQTIDTVGIAFCHTAYNIITTIMLFPFQKQLVDIAMFIVRDKKNAAEKYELLDERLLLSPSVAVAECDNLTGKMAKLAQDALVMATEQVLNKFSARNADKISTCEEQLDMYEDKLGTFLVKLASKDLSNRDSKEISKLLHSIGDFERIGDHAVNLLNAARELNAKGLTFSDDAREELAVLTSALHKILGFAVGAFINNDTQLASKVEPLEEVIDGLIEDVKIRHIDRLQKGKCTIELGFIFSDILNNYERVSDHCSNIAVCVIEIDHESFDTHEYLSEVRGGADEQFAKKYGEYLDKFKLP